MTHYIWNLTDINKIPKNNLKVFSCFSCGGGSSLGYKLAGFDVIGNCEIDKIINDIYIANIHPQFNYQMGIQEMNKLKVFPDELYNLDILDGSPPCSTFSMAGEREQNWGKEKLFKEGQSKQILDDLFFEFIELVSILKPKVVVAENVKGLILGKAKGYINAINKSFNQAGYKVQLFLLNAATMGVPQRRERVFFIATRNDLKMQKLKLSFNEAAITYKEFADTNYKPLNKNSLTYTRWQKRKSNDKSLGDTVKRREGGKISGFTTPYIKFNQIPNTITAGVRPIRFDVAGHISDKDIITIQSFPQDYNFKNYDVNYVCGMSVPPIMMKKIAEQIYMQLFKNRGE